MDAKAKPSSEPFKYQVILILKPFILFPKLYLKNKNVTHTFMLYGGACT